jgi:hypothetical protein
MPQASCAVVVTPLAQHTPAGVDMARLYVYAIGRGTVDIKVDARHLEPSRGV